MNHIFIQGPAKYECTEEHALLQIDEGRWFRCPDENKHAEVPDATIVYHETPEYIAEMNRRYGVKSEPKPAAEVLKEFDERASD